LGLTVVGPVADRVVDLAVGPGHGAAGPGTAAVAGMTVQVVHLWGAGSWEGSMGSAAVGGPTRQSPAGPTAVSHPRRSGPDTSSS